MARPWKSRKDIARKQRQLQLNLEAIFPAACSAVGRQIALNLAQGEVFHHALFMAWPGIDRVPVRRRSVVDLAARKYFAAALPGIQCAFHQYTQRSEEHTSELQSRPHLVCRLLL